MDNKSSGGNIILFLSAAALWAGGRAAAEEMKIYFPAGLELSCIFNAHILHPGGGRNEIELVGEREKRGTHWSFVV